jgi:diaminopimelate epimerase
VGSKCITSRPVRWVDDPAQAPLELWGPAVRSHARFAPVGVNFNLASLDGRTLRLRTWEKGVERETLACGSGAIAAAFAARGRGAGEQLTVEPASGIPLEIGFDAESSRLTGDARVVYEGRLDAEALRY